MRECMSPHHNSGPISGAHFNPAVTLGVCMSGKLDYGTGLLYWVAQVFAGADTHTRARKIVANSFDHFVCACDAGVIPNANSFDYVVFLCVAGVIAASAFYELYGGGIPFTGGVCVCMSIASLSRPSNSICLFQAIQSTHDIKC